VLREKTAPLARFEPLDYRVPGLLIIDTPGHESFSNLRLRGSSLCDIAILVVDIMHGLEQQTLESLNMLRSKNIPFIVALNKIDRLFEWEPKPWADFRETLESQPVGTQREFRQRLDHVVTLFAEQGVNAALYTENPDPKEYVHLVPSSAITGEGIPDILKHLVDIPQATLASKLAYVDEPICSVMEVKAIEGHGHTVDVVLVHGQLKEKDTIVLMGLDGPIVTEVRALLTPQRMKEMRVQNKWVRNKEMRGAIGIKISAPGLEKALAGSQMMVRRGGDDLDDLCDEVMGDFSSIVQSVDRSGRGVLVQASTLGSLEALLTFLKESKIPVAGVSIGPVSKKDVLRASVMLEHGKEFGVILAFDVHVPKDVGEEAEKAGITVFTAEIVYHLFDKYTEFKEKLDEERRQEAATRIVFPCKLRIRPSDIFCRHNPIIIGVDVLAGTLRLGTPLVAPTKSRSTCLGIVTSIEKDKKTLTQLKAGEAAAIRIDPRGSDSHKQFGRHFGEKDLLCSHMTRSGIDDLKLHYRTILPKEDWMLVVEIKKALAIQ
jgi:translation initiation factor 5B